MRQIEKFALLILDDAGLTQRLSVKERHFAQRSVVTMRLCMGVRHSIDVAICCFLFLYFVLCSFVMLYESHVNDLALSKMDDESRSLAAEGMGKKNTNYVGHFQSSTKV